MFKLTCVVGTRPEAIKMAPVVLALKEYPDFDVTLLSTGQHAEMLDAALSNFGMVPDIKLSIMKERQSLDHITARVIEGTGKFLDENPQDMLLVHGDTTTTLAATLAAFYRKIPVAHVEAGLRSYDMFQPFPEEANRVITDILSSLCFAPTVGAERNLIKEGISRKKISVTGNTVIDALFRTLERTKNEKDLPFQLEDETPLMLVTAHRRESLGAPLIEIVGAVSELLSKYPKLHTLIPLHKNPAVREVFHSWLSGERVHYTEPLDYSEFIRAMNRSTFMMSDSGGVQEEAAALRKPLLILRNLSERPEAVNEGSGIIVGTDRNKIISEASRLMDDSQWLDSFSKRTGNPFGDGTASKKIAKSVHEYLL